MIYISSLLPRQYQSETKALFAALAVHAVPYALLDGTNDIWLRDFMPVRTGSGKLVSFRYEPSYLKSDPDLRTDFCKDLAQQLGLPVTYSHINLDGGNVVFSPSGERVRIFSENPEYPPAALVRELSELLEAEVLIIPSLKSDMTGHADGMARFLDDRTVLCNRPLSSCGFEQKVKRSGLRRGCGGFSLCPDGWDQRRRLLPELLGDRADGFPAGVWHRAGCRGRGFRAADLP